MKKIYLAFLCIVTVLIPFISVFKIEKYFDKELDVYTETVITNNESEQNSDKKIVEIPIEDIESLIREKRDGITMENAEKLCREIMGEKSEETGFPISYRCTGAVSYNDKLYYVINITWFVNDTHWSYIGNCFVSFDGQEIYDGVVSQDEILITDLRWKQ